MKNKISAKLALAYRSTAYFAETPDGKITVRIGSSSTLLNDLLAKHQRLEWAYLSACNPGSQKLPEDENAHRFSELAVVLEEREKVFFKGFSRADDRSWPDEDSALVLGISLSEALEIGNSFGQLAIVSGVRSGPAVLVECLTGKPV